MIMPTDAQNIYLDFRLDADTEASLEAWDRAVADDAAAPPIRWHLRVDRFIRHAAIGASNRIEGNPLTLSEADAVLEGDQVAGPEVFRSEIVNYGRALDFGTTLAQDPGFGWSEAVIRTVNAHVMRDLPDDPHGAYRTEAVGVGSVYTAPDAPVVPGLMHRFVGWLTESGGLHVLVRVALLHLNLVAIHPWMNGNGRTARILSSMELVRHVRAPELVSIEAVLAERQDEYFRMIREALGPGFAPERHSVSEWVRWYVGLLTDRIEEGRRLREALTYDVGIIVSALTRRNEPLQWGPIIQMAAFDRAVTTRDVSSVTTASADVARNMLRRMANAGWLHPRGRTRGMHFVGTERIRSLGLRSPQVVQAFVRAQTLGL